MLWINRTPTLRSAKPERSGAAALTRQVQPTATAKITRRSVATSWDAVKLITLRFLLVVPVVAFQQPDARLVVPAHAEVFRAAPLPVERHPVVKLPAEP